MRTSFALLCLAVVALVVGCYGQIPTPAECEATFESIGEDSLEDTLKPCALGASSSCCNALTSTLNVKSGQPLAGCLCNQEVLDAVGEVLDGNSLAKAVGFNLAKLQETAQKCGADFAGLGDCVQAATPPPQKTPAQRPAQPTTTTPSLKPQPQPQPQLRPKPQTVLKKPQRPASGDVAVGQVIRGEDGQLYEIIAVPSAGAKFGRKTPFPIITKIYNTLDGVVDGVVDGVLGKGSLLTGMLG